MPTEDAIQALIHARLEYIRQASERRDLDDLMSWQSKDTAFSNPTNNFVLEGYEAVREFYAKAYEAIPTFRITDSKITGFTPEFVVCEMKCEGEAASDLPYQGLKAGDTLKLTGVSLFWWKWEGPGESWGGSLSDEAIRGWKIIREHAYYLPGNTSEQKK